MSRNYRLFMQPQELVGYQIQIEHSDLMVYTETDLSPLAWNWLAFYRQQISDYAKQHDEFLTSLVPLPVTRSAPTIVQNMAQAAKTAQVGPMAAVAGALAQAVGRQLAQYSSEVIVENGGDIYLCGNTPRRVLVQAGTSPYSKHLAVRVQPAGELAVCTSSGTSGHATSFGLADAAIAISPDTALADAVATALGNRILQATDVPDALAWAATIPKLTGCLLIIGDRLGAWGEIELINPAEIS